jgi:hypothetical protein
VQHEKTALQYAVRRPAVLASLLVTIFTLIALQVVLVIKLADWLSQDSGSVEGYNEIIAGAGHGRFAGIA